MLLEFHGDLARYDMGKPQPKLCADIPRLQEGRVGAQYWSVFVESATQRTHKSLHEAMREFDVALRMIRSQPDFEQARTADDIERIHKAGRIACLLGVLVLVFGRFKLGGPPWMLWTGVAVIGVGWGLFVYALVRRLHWIRTHPFDPNAPEPHG